MKWVLPFLFCLLGCKEDMSRYEFCAVSDVEKKPDSEGGYWIATCSDDSFVIFTRMIKPGEGIYYSPYYENRDVVHVHGYIKKIEAL